MRVQAEDPKVGEIYLYSEIASSTWWGDEVTPKAFKEDLDALGSVDELRIYVNSPGGDVFAGVAIGNMIKRHKAPMKKAYVDGLAASIATIIVASCDKVVMYENAMQMVHNPWTFMFGGYNADQLIKMAEDLAMIREPLIATYVSKTGLSREEVIALMDAETWMDAATCKEKGFCDEVEEAKRVAASLKGDTLNINGSEFDLSRYKNRPQVGVMAAAPPIDPAALATLRGAMVIEGSLNDQPGTILAAGRVLSKENEEHIRSAHDALMKVLSQLDGNPEEAPASTEDPAQDRLSAELPLVPQEGPEGILKREPQPEEPQGRNLDMARRRLALYQRRLG